LTATLTAWVRHRRSGAPFGTIDPSTSPAPAPTLELSAGGTAPTTTVDAAVPSEPEGREPSMRPKSLSVAIRGSTIPERAAPAPRPRRPRNRAVDWIATLVILLALPVALVTGESARAGTPTLSVMGTAQPGVALMVDGRGFSRHDAVQLLWDGSAAKMPSVTPKGNGTFHTSFVVPLTATLGAHTLSAAQTTTAHGNGRGAVATTTTVVATLAVQVSAPVANNPEATGGASASNEASGSTAASPSSAAATPVVTPSPSVATPTPATPVPTAPPATPAPTSTPPVVVTGNPVTCQGYPEPRIWLESQSWWMQTPGASGTEFGHAHVGTCFPYGQVVSGRVTFDVKITLFENPGTLVRIQPHIVTVNDSYYFDQPVLNWRPAGGSGELWTRVVLDTSAVPLDGLQELRMFAQVKEPDGKEMHVSSGWQLNLRNGHPVSNYRQQGAAFTEGRGWYTDVDYTAARFSSPLPTGPVSGIWSFNVDLKPGAGGLPVTAYHVAVDENAHMGIPGWVIRQGTGQYVGPISIDTRQLANGQHKLALRADAAAPAGSTNSGVLVIFFTVRN
jgi:hypothetical protein